MTNFHIWIFFLCVYLSCQFFKIPSMLLCQYVLHVKFNQGVACSNCCDACKTRKKEFKTWDFVCPTLGNFTFQRRSVVHAHRTWSSVSFHYDWINGKKTSDTLFFLYRKTFWTLKPNFFPCSASLALCYLPLLTLSEFALNSIALA